MGDQQKNTNLSLLDWDKTTLIEFNEGEYFDYLHQCKFRPRQIRKLRYGFRDLQSLIPIEKLVPHLASKRHLKILGKELRRILSSDSAKNALTCARRIGDFARLEGLIKEGLNLRTDGHFAEIEAPFKRCLEIERKFSPDYAKITLREFFKLSKYLTESGKKNFDGVNHEHIFKFLGERNPGNSSIFAIRTVLSYLYREGHLEEDYTPLVISTRKKRNQVRKFLPTEDVERLLTAIETDTVEGKRCLAFFLLMARLCLRGREILRLQIEDIDWDKGCIFVRGKHARMTTLPFSDEVGKAILDYLRHSERLYDSHLFVSLKPPYRGLTRARPICRHLKNMYEISGVEKPTNNTMISVFRHSLATASLNAGKSITEVRDLMRHENIATTMIYAKYHLPSLQIMSCEWPEVTS